MSASKFCPFVSYVIKDDRRMIMKLGTLVTQCVGTTTSLLNQSVKFRFRYGHVIQRSIKTHLK